MKDLAEITEEELLVENQQLKEEIKLLQEQIKDYHFVVRNLREKYAVDQPILSNFEKDYEVTLPSRLRN